MKQSPLILIADDDDLLRVLVAMKMKNRGWRTALATDGAQALALMAETRPDLVVLDMMMPVMDGGETLARMKADPALAGIPVVMLTARKMESDIVGALQSGASDYLVKPFIPEELAMRVARLLPSQAAA